MRRKSSETSRWKCTTKKTQGETVGRDCGEASVIFSRIGQSYNFTIKARFVLKYGPHLDYLGCKFVNGDAVTLSGHSNERTNQGHG